MAKIRRRDRRTARANARVRFGPQRATLNALLGQVEGEFKQEKQAARGAARSSIRQTEKAREPLRAVYDQALTRSDTARTDVEKAFGDIGAAADPFEAATMRDTALNRQQIADAAARANKELTDRQNEAAIGRQFALGAARQRYNSRRSEVTQQIFDLTGQQGAFVAAQLGDVLSKREERNAAAREAAKARRENRKTQLDVITAADEAKESGLSGEALKEKGKGKKGKGFEPASQSELRLFSFDYKLALKHAKDAKKHNAPRQKAEERLTTGFKTDTASVPQISNPLALSAALDIVYGGGVISQGNVKALRKAGIKPNDLSAYSRKGRRKQQERGFGGARDELAERY